jgi:hypothetical protein
MVKLGTEKQNADCGNVLLSTKKLIGVIVQVQPKQRSRIAITEMM